MRKILLGSTAVAAAALFAPVEAYAQAQAPTVRVGGYFRFNYAFVDQDLNSGTDNAGKNDFASDTELQVFVAGKAANGLTYGAVIEFQVDARNDSQTTGSKTFVDTDEMYMFIATANLGQLRFGDEDGVAMGLMGSGHITNFGTGGVDGDYTDYLHSSTRPGFVYPAGALNDSTKAIYLSPQFFGFDFGASFAFNQGEGEDTGCQSGVTVDFTCDRASTGASRRRNELQLAARWRGSFEGVGLSTTLAGIWADHMQPTPGSTAARNQNFQYYVFGAQATAFGFTFGGHYAWGQLNGGASALQRVGGAVVDDSNFSQIFLGVSYTIGDLIIGANYADLSSAGLQTNRNDRDETAFSVGLAYNLAPGLQVVAEYVYFQREETGFNFRTNSAAPASNPGLNNSVDGNVFILGTRIAF